MRRSRDDFDNTTTNDDEPQPRRRQTVTVRRRGREEEEPEESPERRRQRLELLEVEDPYCAIVGSSGLAQNQNRGLHTTTTQYHPDDVYDVAELFSPPRCTDRARRRGLCGGWSMDSNHVDPVTGRKWDLSD